MTNFMRRTGTPCWLDLQTDVERARAFYGAALGWTFTPIGPEFGEWCIARVDGEAGLTCSVPIRDLAVNWDPVRAPEMFQAIIDDDTDRIGKDLCSPSGLANG